jgi:uncharacterized damage-inducible protein DinB
VEALTFDDLFQYTDWQRHKWRDWFREYGDAPLNLSAGPNGDGRFTSVADLIKHIFFAEKRYVERLTGQPLSDPNAIPIASAAGLFEFGDNSRAELRAFIESFPDEKWQVPVELNILSHTIRATPRKVVLHVLMHEIRHWAQIHTILRLNGFASDFQDFLFSPVSNS